MDRRVVVIQQLDPPAFWEGVIELLLARQCEVSAVDLAGFGQTPPLPEGRTPTLAALADAAAASLPWSDAFVVGNSLGGAVAIELAKRGAVRGAVAISPVGFWTRREASRALGSLRVGGVIARAVSARRGLLTRTRAGRTLAFGQLVARPGDMPETTRGARRPTWDGHRAGLRAHPPRAARVPPHGPPPEVPVTIAWAANDRLTPPHQAERAA